MTSIGRRGVLLGGLGLAAGVVGAGALVEKGEPHTATRALGGELVSGSFISEARKGRRTGWSVAYPPGSAATAALPVLISLHGKGGTHSTSFHTLGLDRFLAQAVRRGTKPFAIASVDGGDAYWHRRRDGSDSGAMVIEELVPLLAARGLDTSRTGLYGWSMGGYGALLLAARHPAHIRGVTVVSPALWTRPGDTSPGAFDDAEDFERHDVFAERGALAGIPLRVDCGRGDPFYRATREYVGGLEKRPAGGFQQGSHTADYWRLMAPAQLAFIGRRLA